MPSLLLLLRARLQPHGARWQLLHFRERDGGRREEEGAKYVHIMPPKWDFWKLPPGTFTYSHWPELSPMAYLAAREAGKCRLNAK